MSTKIELEQAGEVLKCLKDHRRALIENPHSNGDPSGVLRKEFDALKVALSLIDETLNCLTYNKPGGA